MLARIGAARPTARAGISSSKMQTVPGRTGNGNPRSSTPVPMVTSGVPVQAENSNQGGIRSRMTGRSRSRSASVSNQRVKWGMVSLPRGGGRRSGVLLDVLDES